MKFNKIVVVESRKTTEKHLRSAGLLRNLLEDINANFVWSFYDDLDKNLFVGVDLVITLGGDGTFIEAANLIEDSFILGINSHPESSEGALTSLLIEDLDKLKDIIGGKFRVHKRQRATAKINGKLIDEHGVNEVYFGTSSQFHSSRYILDFKGCVEEHRSSGVIISTGTGSSAWYFSAGGEKFHHNEKKLSFIVREPYFGNRLYSPKVIRGEILPGEKIILTCKRKFDGILAVGFKVYNLKEDDVVEISLSDIPLNVLEAKEES